MIAVVSTCACAAYGWALWLLAERAAHTRDVPLGDFPLAWIGASAALVFVISEGFGPLVTMLPGCACMGALVCALTDARTGYVFDAVTRAMTFAALILASVSGRLAPALIGALGCGGALFALYLLTRKRGLGLGDVKLAAVLGLTLGLRTSSLALAIAFISGGAYGAWLLVQGRAKRSDSVRFAPYIAFGCAIATIVNIAGASA
ncbi:MAG: hypothetical protein NVSMB5_06210 [Candidatus Velthaea sp.]